MDFFFELHHDLPREGPGDSVSTGKALALITALPARPAILDVGCGPGMQTLDLVLQTAGSVIAVDTHRPFLEHLDQRAQASGLQTRITPITAAMEALPFAAQTFDLIWAEGAMYLMGFAEGLRAWRPLLRPGGAIAVSELTWLQPDPPEEVRTFWATNYPAMHTVAANLTLLRTAGYDLLGHFVLPSQSWWEPYYTPLEARIALLRTKYAGHAVAQQVFDQAQRELDLYRRYAAWYGYVFYVMRAHPDSSSDVDESAC